MPISTLEEDLQEAYAVIERMKEEENVLRAELVRKDEMIGALRETLLKIDSILSLEINPYNYDHDDVCELNAQSVNAVLYIRAKLAELETNDANL